MKKYNEKTKLTEAEEFPLMKKYGPFGITTVLDTRYMNDFLEELVDDYEELENKELLNILKKELINFNKKIKKSIFSEAETFKNPGGGNISSFWISGEHSPLLVFHDIKNIKKYVEDEM